MMKKIFYIILITIIYSCSNSPSSNGLEIVGLRYDYALEKNTEIFKINESDIECIDWNNQSYKLTAAGISKINKAMPIMAGGLNESLAMYFDGKLITPINIYNIFSSNVRHVKKSPFICIYESTNNIYSKDNWLILNIYNKNENNFYTSLFNEELYNYLIQKNTIKSKGWSCGAVNMNMNTISNSPNRKFDIDYCRRYGSDLLKTNVNLKFICYSKECEMYLDSL